jgi:hypothetical protein
MVTLQDLIHHLEVGAGMQSFNRFFRWVGAIAGVLLLLMAYDLRAYRNLATQEAMDSAQLGRNLAEGRGYSTWFIRPLSLYLLQREYKPRNLSPVTSNAADLALLKANHPDLANPPVYPLILAGLMKVLPFRYEIPEKPQRFWSFENEFYRYEPDFLITLFNQVLFLCLVLAVFFLARRLFDHQVGWMSAILLLGTELFWRFSVSGLSTILLVLIFIGLVWCLILLEEDSRMPTRTRATVVLLAAAAGGLVGLGGLTRYSFCWLILPVLGFILAYMGKRRTVLSLTAAMMFLLIVAPWVVRNYSLSGMPFGTATFAVIENSTFSPEDQLERSISPAILKPRSNPYPFLTVAWRVFAKKLVANCRGIVQSDLPRLGGTWLTGFFLVGLLLRFRSPALGRLRLFLLASLAVLVVVQALGRTKLSDDSPDINSENLLVLLAPVLLVYGVSFFFVMFDQVELPWLPLRPIIIGLFGTIISLPLILAILPPKTVALVYPPYYPPGIQRAANYTTVDELMMSDIPWAVAWYGRAQCVSLSLNARDDFFAINDLLKPISALYLTPQTVDRWTQSGEWGNLFLQTVRVLPRDNSKYPLRLNLTLPQRDGPPIAFPLNYLQAGWPMQLLFTFRPDWPGSP